MFGNYRQAIANLVASRPGPHPTPEQQLGHAQMLLALAGELYEERLFGGGLGLTTAVHHALAERIAAGDARARPFDAMAWHLQGMCMQPLGLPGVFDVYTAALERFGALAQRDDTYWTSFIGATVEMAVFLLEDGNPDAAEPWARRAQQVFDARLPGRRLFDQAFMIPGVVRATQTLAKVCAFQGKHDEAVRRAKWALEVVETQSARGPGLEILAAQTRRDLGMLQIAAGQVEPGLATLTQAATQAGRHAGACEPRHIDRILMVYADYRRLMARHGREAEASSLFAKLAPEARAGALLRRGADSIHELCDALTPVREEVKLATTHAIALSRLAQIGPKLGELDRALELSCEALEALELAWRRDRQTHDPIARRLVAQIASFPGEVPESVLELIEEIEAG